MQKIIVFVFICIVSSLFIDCANKPAVIVNAGDFERLRYEFESFRNEYEKLQSDYSRLVAESEFYADYYRNATAAIEAGIRELNALGTDSANEIARIRTNTAILRNIIQSIITGEQREGRPNIKIDAD
jgi:hypothetical protein